MKTSYLIIAVGLFCSTVTASEVNHIRHNYNEEKTRIVFDLSQTADFSIEKHDATIDIKSAQLGQLHSSLLDSISSPLIQNIHVVSDSFIQISLHQSNQVKSFALNPHEGASHRFVLDIMNDLEIISDIAQTDDQSEAQIETNNTLPNDTQSELSELTEDDALTLFEQAAKAIRENVIQGELTLTEASEQLSQKRKEIFDMIVEHNERLISFQIQRKNQEYISYRGNISEYKKEAPVPPSIEVPSKPLTIAIKPKPAVTPQSIVTVNASVDPYSQLLNKRINTIESAWRKGKITEKQARILINRQKSLLGPKIINTSL